MADIQNAFAEINDPDSNSVSIQTILSIFSNRSEWNRAASKAMSSSELHRKAVKIRIAYLNTLYHSVFPELRKRSEIAASSRQLEPNVLFNLIEWNQYATAVPVLVHRAIRHANWLDLLEMEQVKIYPSWIRFWNLYEEDQQSSYPLDKVLKEEQIAFATTFKTYQRKLTFLHAKILAGKAIINQLFNPEPDWLEWIIVPSSESAESVDIDLPTGLLGSGVKSWSDIESDNDNDNDRWNELDDQNLNVPFLSHSMGHVEELDASEEETCGDDDEAQDHARSDDEGFEL